MTDSPDGFIASLAGRYTIEQELGSGGMATVYLAEDVKHHRKVAVKVLRPELAAVLGAERFLHEIEIAAQLNHPHILALHDSGEADGHLFYVMPVVEGESLRARLDRERQLPIDEAIGLTQQVASALDYAHRHGLIHRDIKPENILLHEGEAMLTDFGIALAVSEAGGTRLTETGVSLGTPHYMSPEQAAGERELDARSDVYSLACVLFEMLAGEPPFTGNSAQSVIAKRLMESPPHVSTLRDTVPEELTVSLRKALARSPADRYDSAAAFAAALTQDDTRASPLWSRPVVAAGLFGIAALGIVGAVYFMMQQLGLPNWVLQAAVVLLVIGLPLVVATSIAERKRIANAKGARAKHRWFSWRRALQGGSLAFVGLALVTVGFMGSRALGIGPMGTLMAKGVLDARDPILLAEFENRTPDTTLAATIAGGLRIDLSQSPVVRLLEPRTVTSALERMQVAPDAVLDEALARQVAEREGVKAVLAGEVASVGAGYMLSARLVSPIDGALLSAVRVTAVDDSELIDAIDRISAGLRERIGESLKDVRSSPTLDRVTTSSLEALRMYTRAVRIDEQEGDPARAAPLLEETVARDTTFAMAYRKLGHILWFNLGQVEAGMAALTRAFELRDRATERERYLIEAYYYGSVDFDGERLTSAYQSTLAIDPDDYQALTNLASHLANTRQWAVRESLALRAVEVAGIWQAYANALHSQLMQGQFTEYQRTLDRFAAANPESFRVVSWQVDLATAKREYDRAEELLRTQFANGVSGNTTQRLGDLMQLRGRLDEAEQWYRTWIGQRSPPDFDAVYALVVLLRRRGASAGAMRLVESYPIDSLPPAERPYLSLADLYAAAGRVDEARALVGEYERSVPAGVRKRFPRRHAAHQVAGNIALHERRFDDAVVNFQMVNELSARCVTCGLARLAHAWIMSDNVDSALAVYERLVSAPLVGSYDVDVGLIPDAYTLLGELYEARNDTTNAIKHYNAFVELWKDADAALQPCVDDVKRRIASLIGDAAVTHQMPPSTMKKCPVQ